ncbi:TPA: hypothetical protein NPN70_002427 [Klebsiella quasipneumoniae subsp. similipneumoniae]|nr:hypothetical protein [Klebsiella quasipneumoniae subsp. similipneumoniae]HCI6452616.1 hypothetical protein [Klebsiella quasipneumoniae subsp. similipneumoniae]HCI6463033.1 hypothetical protein [Klebsiella quasipneumoniae subsp. similipneumoniae]HCI6629993.1 hypothetical protein [Klebsiella quasipneumoniae subsp. similipneumoniae]
MKISYVMILIFSLVLNSCGRVEKFDGTSPESLELSMQKVREQLSTDRKKQLQSAITDIMDFYETEAIFNNDDNYSSEKLRLLVLDGKSADQVISEARSYRGKKAKLLLLHQQGNNNSG